MKSVPEYFLGIDPTAGRTPYTWAILDADCQLTALEGGNLEALLAAVDGVRSVLAAVNAPARPNLGLVRRKLAAGQPSAHLRGADMRLAEYELRQRGISVPPTGGRPETCAAWTQMGFEVHRQLEARRFALHPDDEAPCQRFETNPHAVFCALLGQTPLPKPTLEGRLQRQLVLHAEGVGIADPMDFFEEITRHRLLRGLLPVERLYAAEELDALAAAFSAWSAANRPDSWLAVGEPEEGQIVLPVRELKDKYN
jgi:hypothetical protein